MSMARPMASIIFWFAGLVILPLAAEAQTSPAFEIGFGPQYGFQDPARGRPRLRLRLRDLTGDQELEGVAADALDRILAGCSSSAIACDL